MEEVASFDIAPVYPFGMVPGATGVVITNDTIFLGRFNRKEMTSGHGIYYFTIVYSNHRNYRIGSETYVVDTQLKSFFPVSGIVKIIRQGNNLYMITSKQSYPL